MTESNSKSRHDFINNALRIEVINKMLIEALEKNESLNPDYIQDLEVFLEDHKNLLIKLKEFL